jgi:hypothetical protein
MINLIPFLLVFSLAGNCPIPPPTQINADSLFGPQEITIKDSVMDEYTINKIKLIRREENGSEFVNFCEVIHSYSFKELPFLKLYLLFSGDMINIGRSFPYNYILLNKLDSSLYHFGGDDKTFTAVIKPALSDIIKENKIINLIKLYLYTLNDADFYYALDSIGAYEKIWQKEIEYYKDQPYRIEKVAPENVKNDINRVKSIFKPVLIKKGFWSTTVQIYSWNWRDGNIEQWEVSISKGGFKVKSRKVIIKSVGPHSERHP